MYIQQFYIFQKAYNYNFSYSFISFTCYYHHMAFILTLVCMFATSSSLPVSGIPRNFVWVGGFNKFS